jgi:hypothetical protein
VTYDELLDRAAKEAPDHLRRVREAMGPKGQAALFQEPEPGVWTCGQVVEHLLVSNARYMEVVPRALAHCPEAPGASEVALSFIGGFLVRVAGPDGDAPVPRPFRPGPADKVSKGVLDDWAHQQGRIAEFAVSARGKDLNRKVYRNPVVPVFRMCLADFFMLAIDHTERHVRQIEERAGRLP